MYKTLTAALAAAALLVTACGGDDGGGDQAKVADEMMKAASEEGVELERDCVEEVAAKLSDDDAKAILATIGSDEEPDVSAEADALAEEMFGCIDPGALVDQMMEEIGDQPGMDKECVRGVLEGLSEDDILSLAQSEGDMSGDVMTQLMQDIVPCVDMGG